MNEFSIMKKVGIGSVIAGAFFLSGCGLQESIDSVKETTAEVSNTVQEVSNTVGNVADSVSGNEEISQAQFEKAFKEYLKNKPVEFGKEVDNAYKIYQAELQKEATVGKLEKAKSVPDIIDTDHVRGSRDADFVLFEYSDYNCPFCKRFHPTTKQFLENNDDIAVVLRPYPGVHRNTSAPLHELAECIAKEEGNDAFWKFSDVVFEKAGDLTIQNAANEFTELGISKKDEIMKCYESGEFKDLVNAREAEAQEMGILGTPGSILKNMKTGEVRVVEGAYPLEALEQYKKELE